MKKSQKEWGSKLGLSLEAMTVGLSARSAGERADLLSILVFEVGGQSFGVGVEYTEGVVDCPKITPLPSGPDGVIGVASVRGRMTLVIDLSLEGAAKEGRKRLILLRGEAQLGLLACRVDGVVALEGKLIASAAGRKQAAPSRLKPDALWPVNSYFQHAGREVPLIDVARLADI